MEFTNTSGSNLSFRKKVSDNGVKNDCYSIYHRYIITKKSIFSNTTMVNIETNGIYIEKRDIRKIWIILAAYIYADMNRIKEVIEEKGIKQTWLANKLGKSYNMVNGYVQNRQQPRTIVI